MNCRECQHVGPVPNSIHCSCKHPAALRLQGHSTDLFHHMKTLTQDLKLPRIIGLEIKAVKQWEKEAISEGWLLYPFNFDPRWIESCSGFTERSGEINVKGVCCGHAIR